MAEGALNYFRPHSRAAQAAHSVGMVVRPSAADHAPIVIEDVAHLVVKIRRNEAMDGKSNSRRKEPRLKKNRALDGMRSFLHCATGELRDLNPGTSRLPRGWHRSKVFASLSGPIRAYFIVVCIQTCPMSALMTSTDAP
jgi:hypothetical protein